LLFADPSAQGLPAAPYTCDRLPNSIGSPTDGSQVEVVGLDDAEVAFDVGEVFVAVYDRGG